MIVSEYLKDNKEIIQKIRKIPTLDFFEDKDLEGLLNLSRIIKYEPGEMIIKEGQHDNWIYFILSGKVGIQKEGETIGVLKRQGDIFGEMGIIDGSPRSATIIAIEETACLAIDSSYADRLSGNDKIAFNCILYRTISQVLASRLRIADKELVKLKDEITMLKAEKKLSDKGVRSSSSS